MEVKKNRKQTKQNRVSYVMDRKEIMIDGVPYERRWSHEFSYGYLQLVYFVRVIFVIAPVASPPSSCNCGAHTALAARPSTCNWECLLDATCNSTLDSQLVYFFYDVL